MMETAVLSLIWLFLYGYCIEGTGAIQKGRGRWIVAGLISLLILALSFWIPLWTVWLLEGVTAVLFVLFFDEEPFRQQWKRAAAPALLFSCLTAAAAAFGSGSLLPVVNGIVCLALFLLLAHKRGYLRAGNAAAVGAVYVLLSAFPALLCVGEPPDAAGLWVTPEMRRLLLWGTLLVEVLLFFALEGTLFSWQKGFERSAERFQQDVLTHQYEEIRTIYTNMRGWRHDYHNHLQVIKAQLALGETEQLQRYLDELEQDLDRVDSWIKSGNLMADAILNSKLSLAQQKKIAVNCKARLPETLLYKDTGEGVEISGGEAQKLAIARALYKDGALVVLDEPTAALDPLAEAEVYARFDEMTEGKTSIYISHRMSSCRFCDDIIVFDDGRIEERGSHETLLAAGGLYSQLWNAQAKYYA